jgi:hypothetical protein
MIATDLNWIGAAVDVVVAIAAAAWRLLLGSAAAGQRPLGGYRMRCAAVEADIGE